MDIPVHLSEPRQHTGIVEPTGKKAFFFVLLLGILDTITPFSIDMYLPAFPGIAHDLHTTTANMSLTVSSYFLGFALGQILYGPLLDRYGRKSPLYIGLCLYIITTLGCIWAGSLQGLLVLRFVQALGGCVASVAAMALVQDFFPPARSASIISFLILVLSVSPLLAPSVGSFVINHLGWHYVFILLAVIVVVVLVIVFFFLPPGAPPDTAVSLRPKDILSVFKQIITEPQFSVFAFAGTFSFAGLFIYVAGSPAVFMDFFHLTASQYGGVFALLSVGFIGGSQLNHLLHKKYTNEQIFKAVLMVQIMVSVLFVAGVISGWLGLAGNLVFLFLSLLCAGLGFPNAASLALTPFRKQAGSASALLGSIQIGIGGAISSVVGLLHMPGSLPIAGSMMLSTAVALLIFQLGNKSLAPAQLAGVAKP